MNKPKTKREIALCRCKLATKVACDALDGKLEHPQTQDEQVRYALYNIASAIGDIAEAMKGANMETFNLDREITWLQEEIGFDVCAAESGDRDGLYRERMAENKTKLEKLQAEAEAMKGNQ